MLRFIFNLIALILMIAINALANILPLNGQTTGEVSNKLDVLFTPAGYVFSIWGLIYFLLGIWVLRGLPKHRRNAALYTTTSGLFVLSSLLNSLWIFLWHYEYIIWTVVVMVLLLLTLIRLYGKVKAARPSFWDQLPFSIYLGWVSVATIANISYALVYYGWDGFGLSAVTWTIIMLLVAAWLSLFFRSKENDWVYPLVFVWAFIGIGVRTMEKEPMVAYTAYGLAFVIFIGIFLLRKKQD
ncbi:tryptophan-rich sensory protein [Falsibacillus albus]|uniref:Tryptophan-rich sensory protein n=1 Tax=Falsibacillus albus TaxID=2478915 RepID=A0A3L7JQI2_9BACI|nr:tryptophan-rich sensory protein [Falsibacillus albus]RLQ93078.1 tryptophan-rich sensory protein [Falsibacillus albus]